MIGLYLALLTVDLSSHGNRNNTKIAPNIAITPMSLFGIDLKMA